MSRGEEGRVNSVEVVFCTVNSMSPVVKQFNHTNITTGIHRIADQHKVSTPSN